MNEINKIERNVLDAYFSTRVNNAPPPSQSNLFVTDNNTTLEIVEALDSTYPLTQQDVVSYIRGIKRNVTKWKMIENDYIR